MNQLHVRNEHEKFIRTSDAHPPERFLKTAKNVTAQSNMSGLLRFLLLVCLQTLMFRLP